MQHLSAHDDLHVQAETSNVHHIQVPHPPCISFHGNISEHDNQAHEILMVVSGQNIRLNSFLQQSLDILQCQELIWEECLKE